MIDGARAVAAAILGTSELWQLPAGSHSQAWLCVRGSERFVVRVGAQRVEYERDDAAWRWWHDTGVVAEVLHIGDYGEMSTCVSRWCAGTPLERATGLGADDMNDMLDRIATLQLPGSGYGPWEPSSGNAPGASWREWLVESADAAAAACVAAGALSTSAAVRWCGVVGAASCPVGVRGPVHTDLGASNVLVEDRPRAPTLRFVVLDWANSVAGDPFYDAASLVFWDPWHAQLQNALRALGWLDDDRIAPYAAHIGLQQLAFSVGAGRSNTGIAAVSARMATLTAEH